MGDDDSKVQDLQLSPLSSKRKLLLTNIVLPAIFYQDFYAPNFKKLRGHIVMPPTSKKLRGHIGLGLSVQ